MRIQKYLFFKSNKEKLLMKMKTKQI